MADARTPANEREDFDPNVDRYSDPAEVLGRIRQEEDLGGPGTQRVVISFLADGSVAWKSYGKDPDQETGGVYLGD